MHDPNEDWRYVIAGVLIATALLLSIRPFCQILVWLLECFT